MLNDVKSQKAGQEIIFDWSFIRHLLAIKVCDNDNSKLKVTLFRQWLAVTRSFCELINLYPYNNFNKYNRVEENFRKVLEGSTFFRKLFKML